MSAFTSALHIAVAAGTVIVLAGLGELLLERTGVMNLGIEGIVSIGAVAAVLSALTFSDPWVCLLIAMAAGMVGGALFALFAVVLRIDQVLVGLAIFLIGIGLTNQLGSDQANVPIAVQFGVVKIPGLVDLPVIGKALFNQPLLVYIAYVVLPIAATLLLFRTRHGINLRSVGEDPAAADGAGVNVTGMRIGYSLVAGALQAAGGAFLMLSFTPSFSANPAGGRGWIALAAVIFAGWVPWRLVFAALLFGGMISLGFTAQAQNWNVPTVVFTELPYVMTLVLMVAFVARLKLAHANLREVAPAALGEPYFREER